MVKLYIDLSPYLAAGLQARGSPVRSEAELLREPRLANLDGNCAVPVSGSPLKREASQ